MLKATHIPIVGTIWVYEMLHERFHGENVTFSTVGPSTTATDGLTRPYLASRPPMPSPSVRYSTPNTPLRHSWKPRKEGKDGKDIAPADPKTLEAKVDDLTTKIAELTALFMAQQSTE